MRASRTNNGNGTEYLVMYKVYVQPDGGMVVVMGNQKLEVSQDEVHALLCGTMDYAKVFAALHATIGTTNLAILEKNRRVNGNESRA